jgi:hypothetical protein
VGAEPPSKANPLKPFQSVWYRIGLLFWALYLPVMWFALGPANPWYALMVVWTTSSLVPAVPAALMRRVPRRWHCVPGGERVLHRIAGVGIFGWLLHISGWNRHVVEPMRRFSGKRAALLSLEQAVRRSASAHGICFAIHALLAVLALFTSHPATPRWSGVLWMLLPGVVVHLYPVLLQRSLMLRLQPLLDKTGSC